MFNNVTYSSTNGSFTGCFWYGITESHRSVYYAVALSATIIFAVLSPVAVLGNVLITAAIWKNRDLRTPSYIFLCGLALTDFFTGLVAQPLHAAAVLICLERPQQTNNEQSFSAYAKGIAEGCGAYFTSSTLLLLTLMSVERWLHITHPSLLTVRRSFVIMLVASLLLIPVTIYIFLYILIQSHPIALNIIVIVILLLFLITTSIAYFKVFRNIRHQHKQIYASKRCPQSGRCALNLAKYKRSVITILYILGTFYFSVLPLFIFAVLYLWYSHSQLQLMFIVSVMFLFLSSSLNPLIYLWRMKDIRNAVKRLLKQLLCKEN